MRYLPTTLPRASELDVEWLSACSCRQRRSWLWAEISHACPPLRTQPMDIELVLRSIEPRNPTQHLHLDRVPVSMMASGHSSTLDRACLYSSFLPRDGRSSMDPTSTCRTRLRHAYQVSQGELLLASSSEGQVGEPPPHHGTDTSITKDLARQGLRGGA